MLGNRKGTNQHTKELSQNVAEAAGKETRQIAAEKAGFGSPETYRQAKSVVEHGTPELVEKMDAGQVTAGTLEVFSRIT